MLKVADVAKRLSCSVAKVYQLIESKRLSHYRCPAIRVSEEQLADTSRHAASQQRVHRDLHRSHRERS